MRKTRGKTAIIAPDAEALRFCGFLGHTYVVLRSYPRGASVERCAGLETCSLEGAIKAARTEYRDQAPAIYEQVSRGKWRPVLGDWLKPREDP